jgi:hypothetical protein
LTFQTRNISRLFELQIFATAAQKNNGPRGDFTCKQQQLRSCKRNAIVDHQPVLQKEKDGKNGTQETLQLQQNMPLPLI